MREYWVTNVPDFIATIASQVLGAEAKGWKLLDETLKGNKVAVKVHFDGRTYRFNANNKLTAVMAFLKDFDAHGLKVMYVTVASGPKIDSANRTTPRQGLYLYRN